MSFLCKECKVEMEWYSYSADFGGLHYYNCPKCKTILTSKRELGWDFSDEYPPKEMMLGDDERQD